MKPVTSIDVSNTICKIGKNTPKSRFGVIHNCMFDIHSNVPCIFAIPHTTHNAHSSGRGIFIVASRLQTKTTAAATISSSLLVKRNFMRNSTGKYNAMPMSVAYRHICTSSRMMPHSPTILFIAPRYMPLENWKQNAISTYIHGLIHRGTKS